jgi:NodT family efflux transporter outer membrane factor (OMF) lipoprotein
MLFIFLLSGCAAVGPNFSAPDAPKLDYWLETEPQIKSEPADISKWWTVFQDPILNQLIDTALNQNLSLQVAGLRILEARAQLGIARGNMYPQVQQITGTASKTNLSENSPNFNPLIDDKFAQYELGFDAAWELDFWGRFRRGIEAADASLSASITDYQDALVSLTGEVARVYVSIRTFEERMRLAQDNIKLQERSLQITEIRFRNGATTELDVQQAKSNLANTQALLPVLRQGRQQAKNVLNTLLAKAPGEIDAVLGDLSKLPEVPAEVAVGIPAELLRRRPDVRRAEYVAAAQSARIGLAKAELYPSFTLFGSIGFQTGNTGNNDFGDLFGSSSLVSTYGPTFKWNILNYDRIKNNVRAQDARFQQALAEYKDTVLRAYQETENAITAFLQSQLETKYRDQSATAAKRSAELANIQYREGAVDFQRVVDTERFLVSQQDQLTVARGDIALNLVATFKALGGGWEAAKDNLVVPQEIQDTMRLRTDWGNILTPKELSDGTQPIAPAAKQPLFPNID